MKLSKLDLTRLHNAEFGQLMERIFNDIEKSDLDIETNATFKQILESLKETNVTYGKSLEQIRENEKTKKIAELDKMRDDDFIVLRDSIKVYRKVRKEQQVQAYNALKIVFDEYKNLAKLNYEAKTKKLSTLVSVLKSTEYKAHITALNVSGFLQELEKSNKAFDDLFAERSVQYIAKENLDTKNLRKELTELYRKLCTYTETLATIEQEEFFIKALDIINNSRKYFADLLAKREGISKGKKKTEEKE